MPFIDINSDALVKHTARLERLHRSALPVAVRNTLSRAAFDVKKETMPASAKRSFVERKATFFKANSKVTPAQGFNIASMQAVVGFVPKGAPDHAVEDLEQQEGGGTIEGRSYIPLPQARVSKSWRKNVRSNARISDIKSRVIDARKAKGRNAKERFIKSAVHAGKGGFVLGDRRTAGGNRILFQVRGIHREKGKMLIKSIPLFALKSGRKVEPKATHFMRQASYRSAAKMNQYFIEEAQKQINRIR
jgi:hypothetical protein